MLNIVKIEGEHFNEIYMEESSVTIVEVVHMKSFFPSLVFGDDNGRLLEEVSKAKLDEVLRSFRKDKSLRHDGWQKNFFYRIL
jgi:hypothetical protein